MSKSKYCLYSGGLKGAEQTFGECAERYNIDEVTFSFDGHRLSRKKNVKVLSESELSRGHISMEIISTKMGRKYAHTETIRKVFQVLFHMVNNGYQVFSVGWIQADRTVRGGTGWGIELAKFFNRPVSVFDLASNEWHTWQGGEWVADTPVITHETFCGTGTRNITPEGIAAIRDLFARSFG